jgi:hydroxymethylbilane synthase
MRLKLDIIKIAARQSDLARLQAYKVGEALKKAYPSLKVEYQFRASLGDKNLTDPLWKMPEKGVFTQDFFEDLVQDKCDLVVHSWKDLPIETQNKTEIAATMERADSRDLLLVRKDRWQQVVDTRHFHVFSSSPRREYNLKPFFKKYLPTHIERVVFVPVRGNVPTRIEKLFSSDVSVSKISGLVMAKAALDRLLNSDREEFVEVKSKLRARLSDCYWMVLPQSQNPAAAAQGALAVEIHSTRDDMRELLKAIHDPHTFEDVKKERDILKSYGGGCHQKIGVSVKTKDYGTVISLRGLTDQGVVLDEHKLVKTKATPRVSVKDCWPNPHERVNWFEREDLPNELASQEAVRQDGLWVARANALPASWKIPIGQRVWTAGLDTWFKLALRGVWVNGTSDSLGEAEEMGLDVIDPGRVWCKLTHDSAPQVEPRVGLIKRRLATYKLQPSDSPPKIGDKKYFYWMSGSSFESAIKHHPHLVSMQHACGPGHTLQVLKRHLAASQIDVFLSLREWYETLTGEKYV